MRATSVVALGCWASAGTIKALGAGLGWLPAIMLGVITAVGGGILRDFCIGEIPSVLGGNTLYATAALAASAVLVITPHHCTDPGNRGTHRRRCRSLPAGRMASLEAAARPLLRADQNRTGSSSAAADQTRGRLRLDVVHRASLTPRDDGSGPPVTGEAARTRVGSGGRADSLQAAYAIAILITRSHRARRGCCSILREVATSSSRGMSNGRRC